jgi:AhpC/TSA family/Disulphide bond corrector protein DsbC
LEESREELRKRGLGLAAISYDSVAVLKHFADRKNIRFALLSDSESKTIRAFGLLNEEVPKASPFHGVPHPVTYIVDGRGLIKSRHFEEDYRKRYTSANILTEQLNIRTGAVSTTIKNPRLALTASSSNQAVRGGERIRLILDVQLPRKMHVYAPGVQGYIPIEWKLNESAAFEEITFRYPPSRMLHLAAIKETVPVYENQFSLQREIVISQPAKLKPLLVDSTLTVEGSFRYQACDDKKCYIPETIPLKWLLRFEPPDSQRVPPELQRKGLSQ